MIRSGELIADLSGYEVEGGDGEPCLPNLCVVSRMELGAFMVFLYLSVPFSLFPSLWKPQLNARCFLVWN